MFSVLQSIINMGCCTGSVVRETTHLMKLDQGENSGFKLFSTLRCSENELLFSRANRSDLGALHQNFNSQHVINKYRSILNCSVQFSFTSAPQCNETRLGSPVENRPSTKQLHYYVPKKEFKKNYILKSNLLIFKRCFHCLKIGYHYNLQGC